MTMNNLYNNLTLNNLIKQRNVYISYFAKEQKEYFYVFFKKIFSVFILILIVSCTNQKEAQFKVKPITDDANAWWARALGDINGDGLLDVALQDNNAYGGWLGWLEATENGSLWKQHIIAGNGQDADTFACGDFDIGDIDSYTEAVCSF